MEKINFSMANVTILNEEEMELILGGKKKIVKEDILNTIVEDTVPL